MFRSLASRLGDSPASTSQRGVICSSPISTITCKVIIYGILMRWDMEQEERKTPRCSAYDGRGDTWKVRLLSKRGWILRTEFN